MKSAGVCISIPVRNMAMQSSAKYFATMTGMLTRDEFLEILQDYIRDGQRSVLFSTHITTDLERVADYITLINRGNMIFTGSMACTGLYPDEREEMVSDGA